MRERDWDSKNASTKTVTLTVKSYFRVTILQRGSFHFQAFTSQFQNFDQGLFSAGFEA